MLRKVEMYATKPVYPISALEEKDIMSNWGIGKGFLEKVENIDRPKVVSNATEATTCTNNKWWKAGVLSSWFWLELEIFKWKIKRQGRNASHGNWRVFPAWQVFKLYQESRAESLSLKYQGVEKNGKMDKDSAHGVHFHKLNILYIWPCSIRMPWIKFLQSQELFLSLQCWTKSILGLQLNV